MSDAAASIEDHGRSIQSSVIAWVVGQPFNNVLTIAMLASILYGGYATYQFATDAVKIQIPAHIKAINEGYRATEESHDKAIKSIVDQLREQREIDRDHTRELVNAIVENRRAEKVDK